MTASKALISSLAVGTLSLLAVMTVMTVYPIGDAKTYKYQYSVVGTHNDVKQAYVMATMQDAITEQSKVNDVIKGEPTEDMLTSIVKNTIAFNKENLPSTSEVADTKLLMPEVAEKAQQLVRECEKQGLKIRVTSTVRTIARQDALYAQGRTAPGNIVTQVKGSAMGSYHQWGLAFDICINDGGDAYDTAKLTKAGKIGEKLGLEWGGSWTGFVDMPHFQLTYGYTTNDLKKAYELYKSTGSATGSSTVNVNNAEVRSREKIVAYAMQFLGNPYVWGGTSLTNGCDCSGFCLSVYAHFGVTLPRTSTMQKNASTPVDINDVQPGDLVFYPGHVAMYIGDGKIIHAKGDEYGICIDKMNYMQPIAAGQFLKD